MPGRMRQLSIGRISAAAFELLDDEGLDAFSLRKLALRLDVHVSALYRHFENREALLIHLTQTMLSQPAGAVPSETSSWQEWLLYDARCLRKNLLAHRDGPQLCMAYHQHIHASHSIALFAALDAGGFTDRDAAYCISTVVNYVIGFALEESYGRGALRPGTELPNKKDSALGHSKGHSNVRSADMEFEFGLNMLLGGMERLSNQNESAS